MIFLMQTAPLIPSDTPTWILVALALMTAITTGLGIWKVRTDVWAEKQRAELVKANQELTNLKVVRSEVAATVIATITPNEIFKVLYVGSTDQDQIKMVKFFRVSGVMNQVITYSSVDDAFQYLKLHPSVLFVIILVTDIKKGTEFLDRVMGDDATKDKTVFFMDGNDPAMALAAYEGGGAGVLKTPLEWTALLSLMNKQGLTVTIEKVKGQVTAPVPP